MPDKFKKLHAQAVLDQQALQKVLHWKDEETTVYAFVTFLVYTQQGTLFVLALPRAKE
jgi:hypothetical protein